ncbi:MAG: phosphate ABC transporter ATP-binding protein [Pseudomonadales bacterium]|nr:phosphate ABC transporter ATP-binding protein [Pseudomonadales bacterium]
MTKSVAFGRKLQHTTPQDISLQSGPPAISIRNLGLSYGGHKVLKNINFEARAGKITALVGPSGCGKSSLLSVVNRLSDLQACKVEGEVFIAEDNILHSAVNVLKLRRRIGMVFQKPSPFPMSIRENLLFPLREYGVKGDQLEKTLEDNLRLVGLWDEVKTRLNDSALVLSGGQQQRLCFARCLSLNPKVLLLDEPCSALDPRSTQIIEALIWHLRESHTILMVTHNLAQARRLADDVAVCCLSDGVGSIVESGKTAQVFDFPAHPVTAEYLGFETAEVRSSD